MVAASRDGTIDVIVSDHDPQDAEVKRQPFAEASDGAVGLETLLAAALRLSHGDVAADHAARALSTRGRPKSSALPPAAGAGAPADLILFDPDYPWVVDEAGIRSRSQATPPSRAHACRAR